MTGSDTDLIHRLLHGPALVWYAASDDVVRMGPYLSQVQAWEALRRLPTSHSHRPVHLPGAYVWPELVIDDDHT